jgi:hypothetical protein
MNSGIRRIFNETLKGFRANRELLHEIQSVQVGFVNKNQDHIEFFGGGLTGVQVVRFTSSDEDKLFIDLLQVDAYTLQQPVHNLPDINPSFAVSSNIFNIACIWLCHAIHVSTYLNEKEKHDAKLAVMLYLHYKLLTSILYNFFKYPANPETAAATYEALSYQFVLKEKGSWGAALQYRAEEVIASHSIWHGVIEKLDNDYDVVRMLNDVQGRIKSMMINIYRVFMDVHNRGTKIKGTSTVMEIDGETLVRDKTHGLELYLKYINRIAPDKNSFYKPEIFQVICNIVPTAPPHRLEEFIFWMSDNFIHIKSRAIPEAMDMIMVHAFEYMQANKRELSNHFDLTDILKNMRGTYTSSRASHDTLMEIKDRVEKLIRQATPVKNDAMVAALRTAFCLYVIARAFTMRHFNSQ